MKKVVVNAKEFVADIRTGKSDQALMQDYSLSPRSLLRLKNDLLTRRLISVKDLKCQGGRVRTRKKISSERFLYDFRQKPDDLYLMEKYGLKPHQLRAVYLSLIKRRLLTDFEYESRQVRVPAVEEERRPTPLSEPMPAASTVVSLVDQTEDTETQYLDRYRDSSLPPEFFKDFSGVPIGQPPASELPDFSTEQECAGPFGSPHLAGDQSTVVEIVHKDYCPKCGRPRVAESQDACLGCGIIFSKVETTPRVVTGAVWPDDTPDY